MPVFKIKNKKGTISYGYDFRDRSTKKRYRKIVPLARTKWDAEQAEIKAKQELLEKRHGIEKKEPVCFQSSLIMITCCGRRPTKNLGEMMLT